MGEGKGPRRRRVAKPKINPAKSKTQNPKSAPTIQNPKSKISSPTQNPKSKIGSANPKSKIQNPLRQSKIQNLKSKIK
jgi:hypothetical protein